MCMSVYVCLRLCAKKFRQSYRRQPKLPQSISYARQRKFLYRHICVGTMTRKTTETTTIITMTTAIKMFATKIAYNFFALFSNLHQNRPFYFRFDFEMSLVAVCSPQMLEMHGLCSLCWFSAQRCKLCDRHCCCGSYCRVGLRKFTQ